MPGITTTKIHYADYYPANTRTKNPEWQIKWETSKNNTRKTAIKTTRA